MKCHLGRAHQLQWQKFIKANSEGGQEEGSGEEEWHPRLERFSELQTPHYASGRAAPVPQNTKLGINRLDRRGENTSPPLFDTAIHPMTLLVHGQILGSAPAHHNDLRYPCSSSVKSPSEQLPSASSRCPGVRLSRIQFGGSALGLWSPSPLCPGCFLVTMSSNELLTPA